LAHGYYRCYSSPAGGRRDRAAQVGRRHLVLDGVDLLVPDGAIFSLLGPNGAGKTTMIHVLPTLIRVDSGEVHVAGHEVAWDPDAVRAGDRCSVWVKATLRR
jgi:ABC-type multidrug transport system ATPase subunit